MEAIKEIIGKVIKNIERGSELKEDIASLWAKSINKRAAKHTKAIFAKGSKIYINVDSPAWLHELNSQKEKITKKLNKFSNKKIKSISLRLGDIYGNY